MNKNPKYMKTAAVGKILLASALCLAMLAGCDFLERDVPNQTTEEDYWQTRNQLNAAINRIYEVVPPGTITYVAGSTGIADRSYANQRVEQEGITDNGIGSANYVSYTSFDGGNVPTSDFNVEQIWIHKYNSIRFIQRYLANQHRATLQPEPQPHEGVQTRERWAAEARACLAYYHLELFMFYGEIPIIDHVLEGDEQYTEPQPQDVVVEFITEQFELAIEDLPINPQSPSERWRWTKGSAYGWLSYVYLYIGDWDKAKSYAEKVIALNKYDIYVPDSNDPNILAEAYSLQFLHDAQAGSNGTNNEIMIVRERGMRQVFRRLAPPSVLPGGGQTGLSPTASLVDEYEVLKTDANGNVQAYTIDELSAEEQALLKVNPKALDRDPRLTMSIIFPGETFLGMTFDPFNGNEADRINANGSTKTGYWVKKWANSRDWALGSSTDNGTLDFQLLRYAVILLNYVEAAVELNQLSDPLIYEYLNKIRERAGMPKVDESKYNTQAALRELVRRERRVELAFEGHRLFDIRRWRIGEVMRGQVYGATNPATGERVPVIYRIFNNRDYLWPKPASEMNTNPNMVQNPGY